MGYLTTTRLCELHDSQVFAHPRVLVPISGGGPFRPSDCARTADDLERAIARFEAWNLPVKEKGRLKRAVALLQRVGVRDQFNDDPTELQRIANAVVTAGDFSRIAYYLDDRDLGVVFKEARRRHEGKFVGER